MSNVGAIIKIIIGFFIIICMVYNMITGINNHDTYYLILGIIDYIVLKNIEKDIDKTNNV